jgi:hypothetical protein
VAAVGGGGGTRWWEPLGKDEEEERRPPWDLGAARIGKGAPDLVRAARVGEEPPRGGAAPVGDEVAVGRGPPPGGSARVSWGVIHHGEAPPVREEAAAGKGGAGQGRDRRGEGVFAEGAALVGEGVVEGEDAWEGGGRRARADAERMAGGARGSTVVACRRGKKKMTCGPGAKWSFEPSHS